PALHAVQSEACAPLYRVYKENLTELPDISFSETIAEGIRIRRPARWKAILRAIRETDGSVVTVSEREILIAQRELGRQGLYVEPTSAVAVAGLHAAHQASPGQASLDPHLCQPLAGKGERFRRSLVIPLTGSGLKAPS
ncbi:MAG: pyridoxal-phosphate dependent enzyme, partial [Candidatus Bipolaricaulia bacterium]